MKETSRQKQVQQAAIEQASGPDASVRVSRHDLAYLLPLRDESGRPLLAIYYDRDEGLQPRFMGKPIHFS